MRLAVRISGVAADQEDARLQHLWMYGGSADDKVWMLGLMRSRKAVDAIVALHNEGMLQDWGELVTRYPGW